MRSDEAALTRRRFLRHGGRAVAGAAVAGAGSAFPRAADAAPVNSPSELADRAAKQFALLYDSTLCVGCRACELACEEDNALGRTSEQIFEGRPWQDARALATDVFTYVTFHQREADPSTAAFGKVQCMHCIEPACASSCPVSALEKTAEGPVVWHGDLCLGCRYCMMACPFLVPRFEWASRNPRIRKCDMCHDRQLEGNKPACVEACPTGALVVGTREELLAEAHRRIAENPRGYVHHVYGEREAGGTNFLHLAARPFDELGYRRKLPMASYRDYTRPAMSAIPLVMTGLGLALGGIAWVTQRRTEVENAADTGDAGGYA